MPRRRPRAAPGRPIPLGPRGSDVSLAAMSAQPAERKVAVLGAPLDLGQGRRGVDMGPSAIRYAGLAEHLVATLEVETADLGNVTAPVPESTEEVDEHARYLPHILKHCDKIAKLVELARRADSLPLVLGGDHS